MSIATAARELLEETGHRAEQMWPVAESFANAASQTNRVWSFLAINCRPVGDTRFDPGENIALAPVALADCLKGLHAGPPADADGPLVGSVRRRVFSARRPRPKLGRNSPGPCLKQHFTHFKCEGVRDGTGRRGGVGQGDGV